MSGEAKRAHVVSVALAVPPFSADQKFVAGLLRKHFGETLTSRSLALIRATFSHPGIRKRHFAVDDPASVMGESPDRRIARFTEKAVDLSAEAVTAAVEKAGVTMKEVAGLVVNTCTGYICPGLSTYIMERLGLPRGIRLYDLVGSGCSGAIPNLQMAESMVKSSGGIVVSVSVEICSAAFQMDNDLSLILSNALFGDGAAAAVVWDRQEGLELVASAGRYVPEERDHIRFVHKQGQLHNQLSLQLPELVKKAAAEVVADVLSSHDLQPAEVRHWALHTGGEKIINAVRAGIGIDEGNLRATRKVMAEYGNMSSPTVLFVLDEILREGVAPGDWCVILAYGAGLSAHAYLLRKT